MAVDNNVIVGAPAGELSDSSEKIQEINEKSSLGKDEDGLDRVHTKTEAVGKEGSVREIREGHLAEAGDIDDTNRIIRTGADAAKYLLSMRDDGDPSMTFRSVIIGSGLACFSAVMYQIYQFKPTLVVIQGTFIVLIAYFLGKGWVALFPRGDHMEARWREQHGDGSLPFYIKVAKFINCGPWNLKEHALCSVSATSASNASAAVAVFTAQDLFYDMDISATTVICSLISIGLFGYGLCGAFRSFTVWHVESVYWANIPTVKTLQGLHWDNIKDSKPLRWFWYSFAMMFVYEFLPAYIWPWLNSVSIPCLASMNATGDKAATLTRLFGGATNNEGLGLLSLSFDWQYITSAQTAFPLKLQAHAASGLFLCMLVMIILWYSNTWDAQSFPFMSQRLRTEDGGVYPISKVFDGGILQRDAFEKYGLPRLTATFAYSMFMANAAIGALFTHCILFWGKSAFQTIKEARKGQYNDPHHEHMAKHYKEAPWWWFAVVLIFSFVLGLVVVLKENITLPVGEYFVALALGVFIAPFSTLLFSRFGNGIATNNLSKMIAGLLVPERPVGNMYFAAFSHNVIAEHVNLCTDLKMGEYLKIPPRSMFVTQIWGTVLGGFVNYVVMKSIVDSHRDLLINSDGNSSWSGANIQAYNTNAASWAMAKYLYGTGGLYSTVPYGMLIGAGLVAIHRVIFHFWPKIKGFSLDEINLPQFIQYAGYIPYNQSQTCVILIWIIIGFASQWWLRNYHQNFFKNYMYLVTGAFDGASLTALFILSFAVFGAGGPQVPFPQWWGNNVDGNLDLCPVPDST